MAPVTGSTLPYMGDYLQQQREYKLAFDRAKASLEARRSNILSQFGFRQDGDQYRPDTENIAGLYQQQRYGHLDQIRDLQQAQQQRGFTGGLVNRQQNRLRFAQGAEDAALSRDFLSNIGDVSQNLIGIQSEYDLGRLGAMQAAIQAAIQNREFTPATLEQIAQGAGENPTDVRAQTGGTFLGDNFIANRKALVNFLQQNRRGYRDLNRRQTLRRFRNRRPRKFEQLINGSNNPS